MKQFSLSRYLIVSLLFHGVVLLFFIVSMAFQSPLAVVENTNQQDVISAVVLGDLAKSKILPHEQPKPQPVKPKIVTPPVVKSDPPPIARPPTPEVVKKEVIVPPPPDAIALAKKKEKEKEKVKEKKEVKKQEKKLDIKPLFGRDLLADIKKEKRKQQKQQEKEVETQFKKTLQAQAEKSLRQQLLNEEVTLKTQEAHLSQGEVNKYKALIVQAISENWLVPPGVNKKLACELKIRVAKDGRVLEVTVSRSSGDPALDRSARAAVLKSSPLPVPTDELAFNDFRQFALKVRPENLL